MDWKTRVQLYTSDFRQLGEELGYGIAVTESYGWWATNVYLMRNDHALQMEINREYSDVFIYIVRLVNGQLPGEFVSFQYPDKTWCRVYIEDVYCVEREPRRDFGENFNDENVSTQMRHRLNSYIKLIRDNPKPLLDVVNNIDGFRPEVKTVDPSERSLDSSSKKRIRALPKDKFMLLPSWLRALVDKD